MKKCILVISLFSMISCSVNYPIIIKSKFGTGEYSDNLCTYKIGYGIVYGAFEADCDFANIGDTLK